MFHSLVGGKPIRGSVLSARLVGSGGNSVDWVSVFPLYPTTGTALTEGNFSQAH